MMKTITVPSREELGPLSQQMFDQVKFNLGTVPNLYATIGYSETALKAFLAFDATMAESIFTAKQKEAIALVVSEINGCDYCLAAHTMLAQMKGFKKQETIQIRTGHVDDQKLNVLLDITRTITIHKGAVDQQVLEAFFEAGYDQRALIELIALITLRIFTNYVFAVTAIPIDFPLAPLT